MKMVNLFRLFKTILNTVAYNIEIIWLTDVVWTLLYLSSTKLCKKYKYKYLKYDNTVYFDT